MTLGKNDFLAIETLENKRNRNFSHHISQISPLNSKDLDPCAFNLKRCRFEILLNNTVKLEIFNKNIKFTISSNGDKISIQNSGVYKSYNLVDLPIKYHKFYLYGNKICEMVRSKTPKIVINNEDGQFFLMKNDPNPNFEAVLKGFVVYLKAFSNEFKVLKKDGEFITNENFGLLNKREGEEVKESLKKAYMYLKVCLKKRN